MTYYITTTPRLRRWSLAPRSKDETVEPAFRLPVDVREEDEAYALSAVVPGLAAEDLDIQVIEDVITIRGEYKAEDSKFLLRELPSGKFLRSLRLPDELDASKAEAEIKNGILTVRVPKAEHAKPRQIKVNVN
jgi:HSP20 family protein